MLMKVKNLPLGCFNKQYLIEMSKNKIIAIAFVITALMAGGYWLFVTPNLDDVELSSAHREVKTAPLETKLSSENMANYLRPVETLKPLASISKAHVHGPNCNHSDVAAATEPKPWNHGVLPQQFERALVSDAESEERYFPTDRDAFLSLRGAEVGEEVVIGLADNVILNGTLKSLKTYEEDASLLKGVIELSDERGQIFFFRSSEKLNSHIVFNEKSVALVYEDSAAGPSYVQTPISDLFCSSEGAVYPLNHPSNGEPFLQASQQGN